MKIMSRKQGERKMNKTAQTTTLALFNFKETKMGNSETKVHNLKLNEPDNYYVCSYYLHGNEIARFDAINLQISNCGFETNVTKSRLNAILELAYQTGCYPYFCYIFQKDHVWYFCVKQFNTNKPTDVIKCNKFDDMVDITGFIHLKDYSFHSDNWQYVEEMA
jgi:hypothetical protein